MSKILVVVESPGKITKIQSILGNKYLVVASVGHIIDLNNKSMSVEIENNFNPIYVPIERQLKTIKDLKSKYKKSSDILLAMDEDREGEMIAWSIAHVLKLKDPKRIVFNSITEEDILNAVANPKKIDQDMVDAQKARRILDRIVGYELSPILWQHVKRGLSAGRVQSVVVRLIVDKEEEVTDFIDKGAESFFKFKGEFIITSKSKKSNNVLKSILYNLKSKDSNGVFKGDIAKISLEKDARNFIKKSSQSTFKLTNIVDKKKIKNPTAPFTTSTMQQDAFRKFGFSVKKTMSVAQNLYEAGHITYMRTDSVHLSHEAMTSIKNYVVQTYGTNYYNKTVYKSKKQNTQEAHEAVRPTYIIKTVIPESGRIGSDESKLYNLIWKKTVSSQMKPAEFSVTSVQISISKVDNYFFGTSIEKIIFPGFLTIYNIKDLEEDDDDKDEHPVNKEITLPDIGSLFTVDTIIGNQEYSKPPSRFNEGSLTKKLDPDNLNIGRPATTASIIDKIQSKGYVIKKDIPGIEKDSFILSWAPNVNKNITEDSVKVVIGKEENKFIPTALGVMVNNLLIKGFPKILDYEFTAEMEEKLDNIASKQITWTTVLNTFYKQFHPLIEEFKSKKKSYIEEKFTVKVGVDPETGYDIVATFGTHGPMVKMCGPVKSKCKIAPIKEPLTIETITLKDALNLFEYPKEIGVYDRNKIILQTGDYGLYLKYKGKNYSIQNKDKDKDKDKDTDKEESLIKDPNNITLNEAIAFINSKKQKSLGEFVDKESKKTYIILDGQYGKYIQVDDSSVKNKKKLNVGLPKDINIETLTVEKIKEIINNYFTKKKTRWVKK